MTAEAKRRIDDYDRIRERKNLLQNSNFNKNLVAKNDGLPTYKELFPESDCSKNEKNDWPPYKESDSSSVTTIDESTMEIFDGKNYFFY